ncbi:MAG: ECF transporter S component [Clostridia bacterium]|nr:ECF transporter S component [Clostridia bacterium]
MRGQGLFFSEVFKLTKTQKGIYKTTLTAMLSAVAFALMFVEFSIPVIPAFIKFDISDLPALFGSFAFGPLYGVVVELIKNILHILIKGTSSAFVGEMSNFLLGSAFCLTAGLIYKKGKSKKSAIAACFIGALVMGVLSLPVNYFAVYPAYVKFFGLPLDAIIKMYSDILPAAASVPTSNSLFNCLLIFNVPFTFFKGIADAVICIFIYKPLSRFIKGRM